MDRAANCMHACSALLLFVLRENVLTGRLSSPLFYISAFPENLYRSLFRNLFANFLLLEALRGVGIPILPVTESSLLSLNEKDPGRMKMAPERRS